jgi:rhodanese-related sulfurtransferase
MPAPNRIAPDKLLRLIGAPDSPAIIDLRSADAFAADPRFIPGAVRRDPAQLAEWSRSLDRPTVLACDDGGALSHGVAALLRAGGVGAEVLEGGRRDWAEAGSPLVPDAALPPRDGEGRTRWVTRARPKVDRIACPWLIRRFVDPRALFLFVPPGEVVAVAARFDAAPFDLDAEGVHWTHQGERCTFDRMVEEFGLGGIEALTHLAMIVRGADIARPDLAPQAAGLLAVSLGLSRLHAEDDRQLEAGMPIYDALFRWCRDARGETHDWSSHTVRGGVRA